MGAGVFFGSALELIDTSLNYKKAKERKLAKLIEVILQINCIKIYIQEKKSSQFLKVDPFSLAILAIKFKLF